MSELFFDGFFKVVGLNPYGEKYDKVSRIVAQGEKHKIYMLLDVNTEIYPINIGERFLLALSPSLVLNTKDGPVSIQEKFEYIMHGRLYDITLSPPPPPPPPEDCSKKEKLSPPEVEVNGVTLSPPEDCSKNEKKSPPEVEVNDVTLSPPEDCSKKEKKSPPEVEVYASFGGLQLMLRCEDSSHFDKLVVDQKLFLLIRKLES